jgi:hypothetical protein
MTHPIIPPYELVQQWKKEYTLLESQPLAHTYLATRAAQWGADQELAACCEWIADWYGHGCNEVIGNLRAARRPKPPSLKQQALNGLEKVGGFTLCQLGGVSDFDEYATHVDNIRRALEALPE